MDTKRHVGFVFFEFLLFILCSDAYVAKRRESSQGYLSRLLNPKNAKKPLILFVDFRERNTRSSDLELVNANEKKALDYDYLGYDDDRNIKDAPLSLTDLLINLSSDDSVTSTSSESLESQKEALRTALRCRQVDSCVKKCPPQKPSCPFNCQQVFDNLNRCDPPTTTRDPCAKKPRCGKTMPPYWRF